MSGKTVRSSNSKKVALPSGSKGKTTTKDPVKELDAKIENKIKEFKEGREGRLCYPLLLHNTSIKNRMVDDIFDDLRTNYKDCGSQLDVIIDSSGGNIDSPTI